MTTPGGRVKTGNLILGDLSFGSCGDPWALLGDAMMMARKPHLGDELEAKAFYDRTEAIVATRTFLPPPSVGPGKAGRSIRRRHILPTRSMIWHMGRGH